MTDHQGTMSDDVPGVPPRWVFRSSTRSSSSCWPLAFRWASTGSSPFAAGRAACLAPRLWRSSRSQAGVGSGPPGARSNGCGICALPAAHGDGRRRKEDVRATELDPTQRVEFFRDILGPLARGIPFGVWFIRTVDGVDLDRPLEAAEGRRVFELHPLR